MDKFTGLGIEIIFFFKIMPALGLLHYFELFIIIYWNEFTFSFKTRTNQINLVAMFRK